jgi:membrane protease YdiL (CAAX protease family)
MVMYVTYGENPPAWSILAGGAAVNMTVLGIVILWSFVGTGLGIRDAFPLKPFRPGILLPLFIGMIGIQLCASELDNLLRYVMPAPQFIDNIMKEMTGAGVYSMIVLAAIAPFTEEPLFRGIILGGLATHYSRRKAIVYSSILFAVFHMNPYQFLPAFAMGLMFGWLMLETGSLWPCLIAHGFANSVCFAASLLPEGSVPGFTRNPAGMGAHGFQPLWLDALGVAALVLGVYALKKQFELKKHLD